jgi:hypothetical protein
MPLPDVQKNLDEYGGLNITGSRIVFANFVEDPWKYTTMMQIAYPETQKDMTAFLVDCTDCAHCRDLSAPRSDDPPALTIARNKIVA